MPPSPDLLAMTGIGKSFGGASVLSDVAFRLAPGEIVALLGANGAGKSTLMKILTGVYARDAGVIAVEGLPATLSDPRAAAAHGIGFLPQEVSVMPEMTVAENICLPILCQVSRGIDRAAMAARAGAVLADLGFGHIDPGQPVGQLAVAEQRIVEIARALAGAARILVMDEPTAALPERDAEHIFAVLDRLRARGTAVVYISHHLREVFRIADRIEVLRDGRNAGSFLTRDTDVASVLAAMLGRSAGQMFGDRTAVPEGPPLLRVEGLTWRNRLHDVSLDIRRGEIVGIFGLVGSGVEHLGRVLYGAESGPVAGRVTLDGRALRPGNPAAAKAAGLGLVTAERKADGILGELSVAQNLAAAFWRDHRRGPFASDSAERAHARGWIDRLGIRTPSPDQPIRLLSGGNQQKVCVARWLHPAVKVLILEEPTRGVDVGARADIYAQLAAIAAQGLAILVLSSDAEEVSGLSHRAMVMDRGRILRRFDGGAQAADLMAATAAAA
ncbi:MAG: sugar ABC transporter ATP-binding protein [Gemmobacter sp.]